jgi:thioredoxin reductase
MSTEPIVLRPDVVIVGAGPAGLAAAAALAPNSANVLVLDREQSAGGIPRHSDHTGYGMRDLHRLLSGPAYAKHLVAQAEGAGATILTEATVTGWAGERQLEVTSPQGRLQVDAQAVVLATGARERPRSARRIQGDRCAGVYTTGQLQNVVHLHHGAVGRQAVVVGGELVSWSAVVTLREAGCKTVMMTTQYHSSEAYAAFTLPGRTVLRVPVRPRTRVIRIIGHSRLEGVEVENLDTGASQVVECDTLVLTGDWIPDNELARLAGLEMDDATLGPLVDTALRTTRPGVFAVGNLLHPVETADVAALDGRHVAEQVRAWLRADQSHLVDGVRIVADEPFRWVTPQILRPGDPGPPRERLVLWTDTFVRFPTVVVRQGSRVLSRRRLPYPAAPGRAFRIPFSALAGVDRTGGDIRVGLT